MIGLKTRYMISTLADKVKPSLIDTRQSSLTTHLCCGYTIRTYTHTNDLVADIIINRFTVVHTQIFALNIRSTRIGMIGFPQVG